MIKALFVIVGLVGVILVVWAGLLPNSYMQAVRGIPPPHPYPFAGVAFTSAFIVAEVLAVYAIIRPGSFGHSFTHSWIRAFCAFIIAVGFVVFGLAQAMHASPYITAYIWWLIGVAGILLVVFLFTASARLVDVVQSHKNTN
jgi:hypothetical protein